MRGELLRFICRPCPATPLDEGAESAGVRQRDPLLPSLTTRALASRSSTRRS